MSEKVVQLRERVSDSEKITINLGYVDLGRIDLLVRKGSSRTGATSSGRRSATS
jgi:hypothetical protein